MQVFFGQQTFNGGGTRGRRAQTTLGHGFAQFLVVDQLASAFHRGQQRGFRKARRRLGGLGLHFNIFGPDALVFLQRRQVGCFLFVVGGFLAVDGQPARCNEHLAFGLEGVFFYTGDARGDVIFSGRIKNGKKALGHQIVDLLFRFGQILRRGAGGNDGEVIRNLGIVENAFVRMHPAIFQDRCGVFGIDAFQIAQRLFDGAEIVFRQTAGIGTRVGQHLVLFIQRLGDAERILGAEAEAAVGLAL